MKKVDAVYKWSKERKIFYQKKQLQETPKLLNVTDIPSLITVYTPDDNGDDQTKVYVDIRSLRKDDGSCKICGKKTRVTQCNRRHIWMYIGLTAKGTKRADGLGI